MHELGLWNLVYSCRKPKGFMQISPW